MAFAINLLEKQKGGSMAGKYLCTERIYVDSAGKLSKDKKAKDRFLLAAKGQEIPLDKARELGLVEEKAGQKSEDKAGKKDEDKAGKKDEDKAGEKPGRKADDKK